MTDNAAYVTELRERHDLATHYEATFDEWAEYAAQMVVAYPEWMRLYYAAREVITPCVPERGHCATHGGRLPCPIGDLAVAIDNLEQFTRETTDNEVKNG